MGFVAGAVAGGTIEPSDRGGTRSPDDKAASAVVPESEDEDKEEQEEEDDAVEKGKGLEDTIAGVVNIVGISVYVGIHNVSILIFIPALDFIIMCSRCGRVSCEGSPKNSQNAKPDDFPFCSENVGGEFIAWGNEYDEKECKRDGCDEYGESNIGELCS